MEIVITAVGPDNVRLADPIIHFVTEQGASIAEIQMYDHDEEAVFAMLCGSETTTNNLHELRSQLQQIGGERGLSVRVWSPDERADRTAAGHLRNLPDGAGGSDPERDRRGPDSRRTGFDDRQPQEVCGIGCPARSPRAFDWRCEGQPGRK